jgi:hypothetical protein
VSFLTRSTAGSWSTPRPWYLGATSTTTDQTLLVMSQSKIGGYWWLAFSRFKYWTDEDYVWLACSDDGEYWEDVVGVDATAAAGVSLGKFGVIGSQAGYTWAADDRWVFRSAAQSFWSNKQVAWHEIAWRESGARLQAHIDASGGLADPELFSVLTLERGYNVAGTDYYQSAGVFYVTSFEWRLQDNLLFVEAVDALGLCGLWRADQAFRWADERLDTLVTLVAALAGIHSVDFDASAVWADTLPLFSINPGVNGLQALRSLAQRAGFRVRAQEDGTLYCFVPAASPTADYTYGTGEHVHWPARPGQQVAPNYHLVAGDSQAHSAEAQDFAAQAAAGRRVTSVLYDKRLEAAAGAQALADTRKVMAGETAGVRDLTAPPNFALELGDVIDFASGWPSTSGGPWRVEVITEYFNPSSKKDKFYQRIEFAGQASALALTPAPLMATPAAALGDPRFRRGIVRSFNSTTWIATVILDGANGAVQLPVGTWVHTDDLESGDVVAVLLFDDSNPEDGLVIGPYGTLPTNIPVGGVGADGRVALWAGADVLASSADLTFGSGGLVVVAEPTVTSGAANDLTLTFNLSAPSASSANYNGLQLTAAVVTNVNYTGTIRGLNFVASHDGTGVVSEMRGFQGLVRATAAGNTTVAYAGYLDTANTGAGTIATLMGLHVDAPTNTGGGAITTYVGLDVDNPTAAGTNIAIRTGGGNHQFGGTASTLFGVRGATPIAAPDYTVTNPSTDRAFDASAALLAEVRNVLGTVIADLIAVGIFQ